MKPAIRITLFGKFSVHMGDEVLLDHAPHKAQELLAYLTLHRGKAHPRDTLAELLWGDQDTPNSRKYLRQALWQLHSGLVAVGRARAAHLLHAESDWLELALDDRVDVDVVRFEEAFASVNGGRGDSLQPEHARSLAETARLYRGDLLEGWAAEWCRYDRERFRRMYLALLDKLTDFYEARHEYEAAIAYATLSLSYDSARERSHRSLMRALAKSGDRCAAIRQYTHCVETLRDELEVEPEPETVVLEQMIRAGQILGGVREQIAATNVGGGSVGSPGELSVLAGSRRVAVGRSRPA
jgi:DNA-binding SARP family transcriptional activator